MQAPGTRASSTNRGRDFSGFSHVFWSDPGFSRTSIFTARSPRITQNSRSSRPLIEAAKAITGVFANCCASSRVQTKEEGHDKPTSDGRDISNGSSKLPLYSSSVSNGSISRISTGSSSGTINSRQKGDSSQNISWQQQFSFQEICTATLNFIDQNIIGKGNFGTVYKGRLKDGSVIAVKRATKNMHDRHLSAEFESEIRMLSKVEHLNLVKFLGYLEHDDERLIMVEYVNNGTLREHLDGLRGEPLEFAQRLNIAIDIAHAVAYLHGYTDHPIIHRDIKSTNILLTDNLRAKVADFGFARLAAADPDATHVSTQVKGTAGYVDPEYLRTSHLTDRSDVYSFGILLVELVTGRHPLERGRGRGRNQRVTTHWALRKYREKDVVVAMDARMRRTGAAVAAVERVMGLAAECTAPHRAARPAMRRCAEVLWEVRRDFQREQQRAAAAAKAKASLRGGSTYAASHSGMTEK